VRSEARVRDLRIVFERLQAEPLNAFELGSETIRHFAVMLLDDWARAAGHLAEVDRPGQFDFSALVATVDSASPPPALVPVRESLLLHARWLHFWLWTYRNECLDAKAVISSSAENDNVGFDESWMPKRARALLTRIVENVPNLDQRLDRERIASLAAEAALRAPSVEVVASVVADFVSRSVTAVLEAASARPKAPALHARRAAPASSGTSPSGPA
jgi:hypothetical protein